MCSVDNDSDVKIVYDDIRINQTDSTDAGGRHWYDGDYECEYNDTYVWSTTDRVKDTGYVGGLRSQLKPRFWYFELSKELDQDLVEYLWSGVYHGFRIVDTDADISGYLCSNYSSVLENESAEFINSLIMQELLHEKFVLADHKPLCVHALGAVRKKSGGYRPITDCKRPLFESINNYMEDTFSTFKYKSSDDVCNLMFPYSYMATVDIASAYRTVSIHPEDWEHQGLSWLIEGSPTFLFDTRISFGLRCAPYIFTNIGNFIVNCMSRKGYTVINYIDDFWVQGTDFDTCQLAQLELIVLLGRLGFSVAWEKCTSPSQHCIYLGLLFDSSNMSISLPNDKLESLHSEMEFFDDKKRATKKQIRRLAGVLSHCARVVRGGRTFSRRVLDLLKGLREGNPRIYLNDSFREDIKWWRSWARVFNGICPIIKYNYGHSNCVYSDASFNGFGIAFGTDWVAGYFNSYAFPVDLDTLRHSHHWCNVFIEGDLNINVLELVPILVAARWYGPSWTNFHIVCFSDNTQVVSALNKGVSSNPISMMILRELFWLSVKYNFYLTARHVMGVDNVIADLLSRVSVNNNVQSALCDNLCCRRASSQVGPRHLQCHIGGMEG